MTNSCEDFSQLVRFNGFPRNPYALRFLRAARNHRHATRVIALIFTQSPRWTLDDVSH